MVSNVKRQIINPNSSNSLVIFIVGSIIAGFAAGLGWGLATKILEKSQQEAMNQVQAYRARQRAKMPGRLSYMMR
jgi:hypothetical protein